jgi:hypothetical protein
VTHFQAGTEILATAPVAGGVNAAIGRVTLRDYAMTALGIDIAVVRVKEDGTKYPVSEPCFEIVDGERQPILNPDRWMRGGGIMRRVVIAAVLVVALLASGAAVPPEALACGTYVSGYYRADGTYVSGHYRTCPNSTTWDNWTTRGNTNPYTGEPGYRSPYYTPSYSPSYSSPSRCYFSWNC